MTTLKTSFLAALVLSLLCATGSSAQHEASGTLTVNGESAELMHGYADVYENEVTVVLSDSELPPEVIPDRTYDLGANGDFKGIVFVFSMETKEFLTGGWYEVINALHFHPELNAQGDIGSPTVTITKLDDEMAEGSITTGGTKDVDGSQVSYEASFSVSLKKEPIEVSVTGADDEASKAYQGWCEALFAGDFDKLKTYASGEVAEAMAAASPDEIKEGLEFQMMMMPNNIEILSSEKDGDQTVLTVKGTRGMEVQTGTVTMFQEDGQWKVGDQSWTADETMD